jgi:vacuolar protein sorting-associated protein 53
MDEILSAQHFSIDVSKLIEIMQSTIEFEQDLHSKFELDTTESHYRFLKCISEVFEPYLKSYSESEEKKLNDLMEQCVGPNDKLEQLDFVIYSSSLRLFKNIKDSMRRCTSFSTSKALFDLQTSFKNVFRHYRALLKRSIPSR